MEQLFFGLPLFALVFNTLCSQVNDLCLNIGVLPETVTPSGIFRGAYNVSRLGRKFETYRGIRYAEPPVGALRFQPPKLMEKYTSPVDATKDGPVCPQTEMNSLPYEDMDEDCLRINVYTPLRKDRTKLLPVVAFIHQGAFSSQAARSDLFGPNYLLDRDIVLVTFNHRLATLGFISTGDKIAPGNNGIKDQVIALRWVQRNIAAFGGNPRNVTLTGYSSGSTSVVGHLVSPMSKGLFQRAIAMSGFPNKIPNTRSDLYDLAVKQARLVDCPIDNSTVILECLKTKPWRDIANTYKDFYIFTKNPIHIWGPIVEKDFGQERFLTMDPIDAIRGGKMNNVSIIISQNEAEFYPYAIPILENDTLRRQMNEEWVKMAPIAFLLPKENLVTVLADLRSAYIQNRTLYNDEESADRLGTLYGDSVVAFPINRLVNLICRHSLMPVWYFEFTYIGNYSYFKDPVTGKPTRAVHQDETIYLFTHPYSFPVIGTSGGDALMVQQMTGIWYNFATYGDPNPREDTPELKGVTWPPMRSNNRTYLRVSNQLTLRQNLKEKRLQLWEQLYPIDY